VLDQPIGLGNRLSKTASLIEELGSLASSAGDPEARFRAAPSRADR
jgi:hypothetical protein